MTSGTLPWRPLVGHNDAPVDLVPIRVTQPAWHRFVSTLQRKRGIGFMVEPAGSPLADVVTHPAFDRSAAPLELSAVDVFMAPRASFRRAFEGQFPPPCIQAIGPVTIAAA